MAYLSQSAGDDHSQQIRRCWSPTAASATPRWRLGGSKPGPKEATSKATSWRRLGLRRLGLQLAALPPYDLQKEPDRKPGIHGRVKLEWRQLYLGREDCKLKRKLNLLCRNLGISWKDIRKKKSNLVTSEILKLCLSLYPTFFKY